MVIVSAGLGGLDCLHGCMEPLSSLILELTAAGWNCFVGSKRLVVCGLGIGDVGHSGDVVDVVESVADKAEDCQPISSSAVSLAALVGWPFAAAPRPMNPR